jgi:hypothetical protein
MTRVELPIEPVLEGIRAVVVTHRRSRSGPGAGRPPPPDIGRQGVPHFGRKR